MTGDREDPVSDSLGADSLVSDSLGADVRKACFYFLPKSAGISPHALVSHFRIGVA